MYGIQICGFFAAKWKMRNVISGALFTRWIEVTHCLPGDARIASSCIGLNVWRTNTSAEIACSPAIGVPLLMSFMDLTDGLLQDVSPRPILQIIVKTNSTLELKVLTISLICFSFILEWLFIMTKLFDIRNSRLEQFDKLVHYSWDSASMNMH